MSEAERTVWTVRLLGRFKRYGETIEIRARAGSSAGSLKALIAHRIRELSGSDATASLVGMSVLISETAILRDDQPPPDGAVLGIQPPMC